MEDVCAACNGANKEATRFYEGYRIWLCQKCFNQLKHEQLLQLREAYWNSQGIVEVK